jgi:hypothetical protein
MKKSHITTSLRLWLLTSLFMALYGVPQPVSAERESQGAAGTFDYGIMTPDIPAEVCTGKTIKDLEFYFVYKNEAIPQAKTAPVAPTSKAPPLVPKAKATSKPKPPPLVPPAKSPTPVLVTAVVTISPKFGKAFPPKFNEAQLKLGATNTYNFTYYAPKSIKEDEVEEEITITVSLSLGNKTPLGEKHELPPIKFKIKKCRHASLQFDHSMTISYEVASVVNNYFGSGTLEVDDEGQISGNGVQAVWSDIPPYSSGEGSCTHSPPWEGSSGIAFNGQAGEEEAQVNMNLEAMSVNSTTLTCKDPDYSNSMTFPAYTYSSCQALLAGFNFEAGTLEVPFACPGQDPFTLPITIIPRAES